MLLLTFIKIYNYKWDKMINPEKCSHAEILQFVTLSCKHSEKWLQKLFRDKQHIFHTNIVRSKCLFRFFTLTILACPPICATTEEEAKHCVYKSKLMMKLFTEIQLYFTWEFLSIKYFLFHLLKCLSVFSLYGKKFSCHVVFKHLHQV